MADVVRACSHCGAPAHWFEWTRVDGEERMQTLADAQLDPLCISCALALPPENICPCQHCQREVERLRGRE